MALNKIGLKAIFDIDERLTEKTKWFDFESQATQFSDFLAGNRPTSYSKNQVVFDEESVRVSEDFINNLDKSFIINGRLD